MKILRISCMLGGFLSLVLSLSAQTFRTLHSFDRTDCAYPYAGLVQAIDGNLYGTTNEDGANGGGTVFKISPNGKLTTVYNFCSLGNCADGTGPLAALLQDATGNLYGTTLGGGANVGGGTIFKIAPGGKLTTLYSFCSRSNCADGAQPSAGVVQATDGNLYGTTYGGGANGIGTVFKVTPTGELTTLYSFCSQSGCPDGDQPYEGLVQATNGNLYGTTSEGGANGGGGTVFKITLGGELTTLYSFCSQTHCTDGESPNALVQAIDGNLYGTTYFGGASGWGTVFKVTPKGKLTTLYSFCSQSNCKDGTEPYAGLVQATDGNLYGTTQGGGANGYGTVFKVTPQSKLTTVYSFCSQSGCPDRVLGLIQATNGGFYGTTTTGGAEGVGTIFSLSVGLGPFDETLPTSGKVGTVVKILGTDLSDATQVTFNGTAAVFKVVSASLIKTIVPQGATTGTVEVTTPKGTLKSNVVFRVTK